MYSEINRSGALLRASAAGVKANIDRGTISEVTNKVDSKMPLNLSVLTYSLLFFKVF